MPAKRIAVSGVDNLADKVAELEARVEKLVQELRQALNMPLLADEEPAE